MDEGGTKGSGVSRAPIMPQNYGYARVSTKEQREDRQFVALLEQGIEEDNVFIDKQSGKDFNRPAS